MTLNSRACAALQTYLRERADTGDPHLFLAKDGAGLGRRSVETIIGKATKAAGLRGVSVRTLRHTFAAHSLGKGTNVETVPRALMDEQLQRNAL